MGGETVREERALPPFDRIAIEGFAELVLVQGGAESIAIEVAPKYLRNVRFEVTDGKLVLANPKARHGWLDLLDGETQPIHATLTFRTLNAISVEGAAKLRADRLEDRSARGVGIGSHKLSISALEAKELAVSGSGAFKMDIAGRTVAQRIRISGAGDYRAAKLQSETAKVTVSGAGRVVVQVEKIAGHRSLGRRIGRIPRQSESDAGYPRRRPRQEESRGLARLLTERGTSPRRQSYPA